MKIKSILIFLVTLINAELSQASVAREWNEQLLHAIRLDQARPTVHARNLYHVSAAMWDAWAIYDEFSDGVFLLEKHTVGNVESARNEAISYAAFRLLNYRFANSANSEVTLQSFEDKMIELGYNIFNFEITGNSPAAIGNRIAALIITYGNSDGSNESNHYENWYYQPINPPLLPDFSGNPDIIDPNRWQPLV